VAQILTGGRLLLDLINEILDLSRIEAGRLTISPEPVAVQPALVEVLDLVNPLAVQRQIQVSLGEAGAEVFVQADRQRLKQVLLNLLSNAIKYNRAGGAVSVAVALTGLQRPVRAVRVSIRDTGVGIPADKMALLFQPFERLGAGPGAVEGTGLGLALAKRLVELMDGRIGAESVVGQGSTFWFELPLTEAPSVQAARAKTQAAAVVSPACMVLYIEDNLANYELARQILADQPQVELLWAQRGGLGLRLAAERRPDIIVLDVHLPDMDGAEALAQLQANAATRHIPVIVLSADATPRQIAWLKAAGATAYLTKPLDVGEFLRTLEALRPSGSARP